MSELNLILNFLASNPSISNEKADLDKLHFSSGNFNRKGSFLYDPENSNIQGTLFTKLDILH